MNAVNLARARFVAYVLYAVCGPVLIYTASRGWTGEAEYSLYVGLGAALGITAAANTSSAAPRLKQRVMAVIKTDQRTASEREADEQAAQSRQA